MGRLVADLLTLTRIDQGDEFELQRTDLAALVEHTVADQRAAVPGATIALGAASFPIHVNADADRLQQLVINLVTNAIRHAPGSRIDVGVGMVEGEAAITVADNGPGMTTDVANRVFDRFFRADESRQRSHSSFGLGLSIVDSIVEAHGGRITLDTAPGDGTRFTVLLPLS